jgi:signal transduction histidine kinase
VIGAAVLVIGLLLVIAGVAAARIPGGATFARPGIGRSPGQDPIHAFLLSPIHPTTWYANATLVLGLLVAIAGSGAVLAMASAAFTTLLAGIGFVLLAIAIEGARLVARVERRRAFIGEAGRPPAHSYKPLRGGVVDLLRAEFADENRWRDAVYVAINLPLSIIEFAVVAAFWTGALSLLTLPLWRDAASGFPLPGYVASVLGLALLPVAASLSQLVVALHRGVVAGLLCTSESRELRRQVETLRQSRSAVLDVEASELHRIERDLHDGAQQRLVMLTIDLGLANERIDTDPAAARQLILEGQAQAREALADIRDLVRGIAPSILVDRGLVPALESISGRGPVPTVLISDLAPGERLPPAAERTAYFVVAEALANVAKHSGARHCEVRCRRDGSRLVVEVWDDGAGGARIEPGGGLDGLASRVAGVDGSFSVTSPPAGPTLVRAEIPLAGSPAPAA